MCKVLPEVREEMQREAGPQGCRCHHSSGSLPPSGWSVTLKTQAHQNWRVMLASRVALVVGGLILLGCAAQVWRGHIVIVTSREAGPSGNDYSIALVPKELLESGVARPWGHRPALAIGLLGILCVALASTENSTKGVIDVLSAVLVIVVVGLSVYLLASGLSLVILAATRSTWMTVTLFGIRVSMSDPQARRADVPEELLDRSALEVIHHGVDVSDPFAGAGERYVTHGAPAWVRGPLNLALGVGLLTTAWTRAGKDPGSVLEVILAIRDLTVWCSAGMLAVLVWWTGRRAPTRATARASVPLLAVFAAGSLGLISSVAESLRAIVSALPS